MKHRSLLFFLLLILLSIGGIGFWLRFQQDQYALNRQLIAALDHKDSKQALALVNAGADPNTRSTPPPAPTLIQLFHQLLHRSSAPSDDSPTALVMACEGHGWLDHIPHEPGETSPEDVPLVQAMLAHGANCNITCEQDVTALQCAIVSNYPNVALLLLEHGANVNAQDSYGRTLLLYADPQRDMTLIRLLLEHGANVNLEDMQGQSALHWALVTAANSDTLRLLLAHGAAPNHPDKYGVTPIMLAQQLHRLDVVVLLRGKR